MAGPASPEAPGTLTPFMADGDDYGAGDAAFLGAARPLTARPIAARLPDGFGGPPKLLPNGIANGPTPKTKKSAKERTPAKAKAQVAEYEPPIRRTVCSLSLAASSPPMLLAAMQADGVHGYLVDRPAVSRSVPPGTIFASAPVFLPSPSQTSAPSGPVDGPPGLLVAAIVASPDVPVAETGKQLWAWQVPSPRPLEKAKRTLSAEVASLVPLKRSLVAVHVDGSATILDGGRDLTVRGQAELPLPGPGRVVWVGLPAAEEDVDAEGGLGDQLGSFCLAFRGRDSGRYHVAAMTVGSDLALSPDCVADLPEDLGEPIAWAFRRGSGDEDKPHQLAVIVGTDLVLFQISLASGPVKPSMRIPLPAKDAEIAFLNATHLLALSPTTDFAVRAMLVETVWGTTQADKELSVDDGTSGSLTQSPEKGPKGILIALTVFPDPDGPRAAFAVSVPAATANTFRTSIHLVPFAVPHRPTLASVLGRAPPRPADPDLEALEAAAASADASAFEKAFAERFLSKTLVSPSDFPSAFPDFPSQLIPRFVGLCLPTDATFSPLRSFVFLLRTRLVSAHSVAGWFPRLLERDDPVAVEAALLHVPDLPESDLALCIRWILGGALSDAPADPARIGSMDALAARRPAQPASSLSAGQSHLLSLALTYPSSRLELVRALRRGLSAAEWCSLWSWLAGRIEGYAEGAEEEGDLESGLWMFRPVPGDGALDGDKGRKKKDGKGKKVEGDWLPGPKGEEKMIASRTKLSLQQLVEATSLTLDANVHVLAREPSLHPLLRRLHDLVSSSLSLYRSWDPLRPGLGACLERGVKKTTKGPGKRARRMGGGWQGRYGIEVVEF